MTTGKGDEDVLAAALLQRHATVINALDGLDRQVASLADRLAELTDGHSEAPSYQPTPAPRWWRMTETERQNDVDRLRAWIEQVYHPGYGRSCTGQITIPSPSLGAINSIAVGTIFHRVHLLRRLRLA